MKKTNSKKIKKAWQRMFGVKHKALLEELLLELKLTKDDERFRKMKLNTHRVIRRMKK